MENPVMKYKQEHNVSFRSLANTTGLSVRGIWRIAHCTEEELMKISVEHALLLHLRLGIQFNFINKFKK